MANLDDHLERSRSEAEEYLTQFNDTEAESGGSRGAGGSTADIGSNVPQ